MTKSTIEIDPRVFLFSTVEKRNEILAKRYSEISQSYRFENSAYVVIAYRAKVTDESIKLVEKKSFLTIDLKYTPINCVIELDPNQIEGISYDDISNLIEDFMHIDMLPLF